MADNNCGIGRMGTTVLWSGSVTFENYVKFRVEIEAAFKEATAEGKDKVINFEICSGGGIGAVGLATYDVLKSYARQGVQINTIASGCVQSAAVFLFLAGLKRMAFPSAFFLIHSSWNYLSAKFNEFDLDREKNNLVYLNSFTEKIVREACGDKLSFDKFNALYREEKNFGAQEALELGFIHEII